MSKTKSTALDAINTDLLFRQAPMGMSLSFACAVVYVFVMSRVIPGNTLFVWFAISTALQVIRLVLVRVFLGLKVTAVTHRQWRFRFTVLSTASGLCWGVLPFLFYADISPLHQAFAVIILTGVSAGSITTMSSSPNCYRLFVLAVLSPLIIYLATRNNDAYPTLALLVTIHTFNMLFLSRRLYGTIMAAQKSKQAEVYRNQVLEVLARGSSLPEVLETIVLGVEAEDPELICSIMLMDGAGEH